MRPLRLMAATMIAFSCATPCQLNASAIVEGEINCNKLHDACFIEGMRIKGEIDHSTPEEFKRLIRDLRNRADREKKSLHPFSVELESSGGLVAASFALGRELRRENVGATIAGTFFPQRVVACNSSCVLVYAAAVH